MTDEQLDVHLDNILKAAGSALKHYSMQKTKDDMRQALREALAQPEQEPVACVQDLDEVKRKHLVYEKGMDWKDPLYTTPPQRKPLTEKVIMDSTRELLIDVRWPSTFIDVWRLCEAAHGIKE